MKDLKYRKDPQAHHIYIQGNKDIQAEPPEVHFHFPCGIVSVIRCTDGKYWIHVDVRDLDENSNQCRKGSVVNARIDISGEATNAADVGDLNHEQLDHFAIQLKPV